MSAAAPSAEDSLTRASQRDWTLLALRLCETHLASCCRWLALRAIEFAICWITTIRGFSYRPHVLSSRTQPAMSSWPTSIFGSACLNTLLTIPLSPLVRSFDRRVAALEAVVVASSSVPTVSEYDAAKAITDGYLGVKLKFILDPDAEINDIDRSRYEVHERLPDAYETCDSYDRVHNPFLVEQVRQAQLRRPYSEWAKRPYAPVILKLDDFVARVRRERRVKGSPSDA